MDAFLKHQLTHKKNEHLSKYRAWQVFVPPLIAAIHKFYHWCGVFGHVRSPGCHTNFALFCSFLLKNILRFSSVQMWAELAVWCEPICMCLVDVHKNNAQRRTTSFQRKVCKNVQPFQFTLYFGPVSRVTSSDLPTTSHHCLCVCSSAEVFSQVEDSTLSLCQPTSIGELYFVKLVNSLWSFLSVCTFARRRMSIIMSGGVLHFELSGSKRLPLIFPLLHSFSSSTG